ncbi:MAG: hypothetical protein RIT43_688 [Bacteroidota bacterium]
MKLIIREIRVSDNKMIAKIIRDALDEYGVGLPGTVYTDPTTDQLYGLFQVPNAVYWIVEREGGIVGGAGLYPTQGLPEGYVELVKLYLNKESRGKGIGKMLIQRCIDSANGFGYRKIYMETMPELADAIGLYTKMGFQSLGSSIGNSGHYSCTIWLERDI